MGAWACGLLEDFGTIAFWLILFVAKLKMTLLTPTLLLLCLGIGVRAGYYPSWLIKIAPINRANVVFYGDSLAQQNGLVNVGQVSKMISLLWVTIFIKKLLTKSRLLFLI